MSKDDKICDFIQALGSKSPVPGGGGACALVGSVGAALGAMVGRFTVGKKKYAGVEKDMQCAIEKAENLRKELLYLIEKDATAFEPLSNAYRVPKNNPHKETIMEEALINASAIPIEIMRTVCKTIDVINEFAQKGSEIVISDAGVASACCKAALEGAGLNVFINTKIMKNRKHAVILEKEADQMIKIYSIAADEILKNVKERIMN